MSNIDSFSNNVGPDTQPITGLITAHGTGPTIEPGTLIKGVSPWCEFHQNYFQSQTSNNMKNTCLLTTLVLLVIITVCSGYDQDDVTCKLNSVSYQYFKGLL